MSTIRKSGPFADPKVRAKWSHVPGKSEAQRRRKAKAQRPPFAKKAQVS